MLSRRHTADAEFVAKSFQAVQDQEFYHGKIPGLIALTKLAYASILESSERMTLLTMNTASHYAIVTGIHIHGPNNKNDVWSGEAYTVVNGIRRALSLNQVADQTARKIPGDQQPSTRATL
jgi:hypothetical protein